MANNSSKLTFGIQLLELGLLGPGNSPLFPDFFNVIEIDARVIGTRNVYLTPPLRVARRNISGVFSEVSHTPLRSTAGIHEDFLQGKKTKVEHYEPSAKYNINILIK